MVQKAKRRSNPKRTRQMRVVRDQVRGVPIAETAKELGVGTTTVKRDRATHDAFLDQYRIDLFNRYKAKFETGLDKGLESGDSAIINGFAKGMKIYQDKSEVEHSGSINLTQEQLDAKAAGNIAGVIDKVKRVRK